MNREQAAALRNPFPRSAIGKIPKGGTQLDYVGHAAVTDRLLSVDPQWSWEPVAFDEHGQPLISNQGKRLVMWIRLTVSGVTRLGVGTCQPNAFEPEKELIGDALRNAAMRFGVALDLWSREELENSCPDDVDPLAAKRSTLMAAIESVCKTEDGKKELADVWRAEMLPRAHLIMDDSEMDTAIRIASALA